MIYSKKLQANIPIAIRKKEYDLPFFGTFTIYNILDNTSDRHIPIGHVDLKDTKNGVFVEYIENNYPELYSGVGKIADQIEVEHCLNRGLDTFEITSDANFNSHALHYKRGKRFLPITDIQKQTRLLQRFNTTNVNSIVENIINTTQAGQKYITDFLGSIPMYMPKELIQKYIEIIKKNPLLK